MRPNTTTFFLYRLSISLHINGIKYITFFYEPKEYPMNINAIDETYTIKATTNAFGLKKNFIIHAYYMRVIVFDNNN